jgi:Uncharacterized conserved protein (DUF2278)
MALKDYGVVLGAKAGYHRDAPNDFGKFFHGHIDIQTPGQLYNTAIDVDSERPGVKVQWKVVKLRSGEWQAVFELADGFHPIASNELSGAVDYLRDHRVHSYIFVPDVFDGPIPPWKKPDPWWRELIRRTIDKLSGLWARLLPRTAGPGAPITLHGVSKTALPLQTLSRRYHVVDITPPWKIGTDTEALTDLEAMLVDAARVIVFGDFYPAKNGLPPGLHDIHQNQGDPPNSPFAPLDAIWQDGVTIVVHSDGTASAFLNKFSTQSDKTDEQGHPA